jgi:secreted PhoX family phosphatase
MSGAVGVTALAAFGGVGHADPKPANDLGFTPITTNALSCSANGAPAFANDRSNQPVTPFQLMKAGDPATVVGSGAPTAVGTENDMIALSQNGKYLFTSSEDSPSKGITRLTLKGPDAGKKELLASVPSWSRMDGAKWYPYGGPTGDGVLLVSEEFAGGGVWQVDPETGATARLDWIGNFSHEGVGLDAEGNLYVGDENRTGAIYRAVPNDPTDLTKGGSVSYLVGTGIDASGWKTVVSPANAIAEANNGGAILFDRPEDFDERNGRVYFTVTEPDSDAHPRHGNYNGTAAGGTDATKNQVVNAGGVYSFGVDDGHVVPELSTGSGALPPYSRLTPMIPVNDPLYPNAASAQAQQGLQFPDNIAFDGYGHLWVHEDIPDGAAPATWTGVDVSKQVRDQQDELYAYVLNSVGDAIVANPSTAGPGVSGGYKAADMRTSAAAQSGHPCENEFTGGVFGQDGKTLYINQQHFDNPTWTIRIG